MNNFKKVGFSALAGSLVATSAMAGEISVSGAAGMYLEPSMVVLLTLVNLFQWITN